MRRNLLGQILTAYREAMQFNQPDDDEATEFRVAAWIPVTMCVPADKLFDCYTYAMQNRASDFPLSAPDLVKAWRAIQDRNETHAQAEASKYKMLSQFAPGACGRCFGTGQELMPDGTVRKGCKHEPLGEDEKELSAEAQGKVAAFMREAMRQIGARKPQPVESAPKPDSRRLVCTNPACARRVSTLYGFEAGQPCRELLNRGTGEGELQFCDGVLEAR